MAPLNVAARTHLAAALIALAGVAPAIGAAHATAFPRVDPFALAMAQATAGDGDAAAFYAARGHAPLWLGAGAGDHRAALIDAFARAADHGLPASRFDPDALRAAFATADDPASLAALEARTTAALLAYARAVATGILDPARIDPAIVLERPDRDWTRMLEDFARDPWETLAALRPQGPGYRSLLKEKRRLEDMAARGGWGDPVPGDRVLRPGDRGADVAALRRRLVAMGRARPSALAVFDADLAAALRRFQEYHGLASDGEAGPATLRALNVALEDRLAQVVLNLERRRWLNRPREDRHVLVNIAEQRAYVIDDGVATFDTVVVVGAPSDDRRTPEFSDTMTHMVVNPTWYVPRSIAVNEYLPALKRGGARHLEVFSNRGRVNPRAVDFGQYTARTFPFSLRQPPGPKNALGKVKFMFPNRHNIYLHDTPSKHLFSEDVRTYSHGCIRVGRPFELAHHLLAPQEADPEAAFARILHAGAERKVDLADPIGVHLVYWSAWVTPDGRVNYRGDPYGRDAAVLAALRAAGVETGLAPGLRLVTDGGLDGDTDQS